MTKLWVAVLCWFLPVREWRRNARRRWCSVPKPGYSPGRVAVDDSGQNNKVQFEGAAGDSAVLRTTVRLYGNNNEVVINSDQSHIKELLIEVFGDNHKIILGKHLVVSRLLEIVVGVPYDEPRSRNCRVEIGANTYIESAKLELSDHDSIIRIGESCQLAGNVRFELTDYHAIFQAGTAELINRGKIIDIGDRVWVGHDVTFLKNSSIGAGCVVGCHSVVAGRFTETDAVIVGNSARVAKRGIRWEHRSVNNYLDHANGPPQ